MTNNVVRVTNWIRKEMMTEKPSGEIIRFELKHLAIGSKRGSDVTTINVPERVTSEFYEMIGAELVQAAESDAEGISEGIQRYVIVAFREKSPDKSQARIAFVVDATDAENEGEIESEPATKQGIAAMAMRHLEATQRLLLTNMTSMMQAQARMVNSIAAENEKLRDARIESIEAVEDLMSQRDERKLEAAKAEAHIAVLKDVGSKVGQLLPVVANKFLGTGDSKNAVAASFIQSLTEEQKAKFMALFGTLDLTIEQQVVAAELLQSVNNH